MNKINILNKEVWQFNNNKDIIPDLQNFLE